MPRDLTPPPLPASVTGPRVYVWNRKHGSYFKRGEGLTKDVEEADPMLREAAEELIDRYPDELEMRTVLPESWTQTGTTVPSVFGTPCAPTYRILPTDSKSRKEYPIADFLFGYVPDAVAQVAHLAWVGNQKHNPGEPLHHARGKSDDHENCIMRHTAELGGFEEIRWIDKDGIEQVRRVRHSVCRAWRALIAAQLEIEREEGAPIPRCAKETA